MRHQCFLWFVMISVLVPRTHLHLMHASSQDEAEISRPCEGEAPFHDGEENQNSCPACEPQALGSLEKLETLPDAAQSMDILSLVHLDNGCETTLITQKHLYPTAPPLYLAHCAFLN